MRIAEVVPNNDWNPRAMLSDATRVDVVALKSDWNPTPIFLLNAAVVDVEPPLINTFASPDVAVVRRPNASTENIVVPVEDATANALDEPPFPCTKNVTIDDEALTPATAPLSRKSPIPRVPGADQRAKNPFVPPESVPVMLRLDVATQRVDVPVL
jgi:hypothetical protein